MQRFIALLAALTLGAAMLADAAQAARLGGGRSLGTQRQSAAPQRQATPPSQQQQPAAAPQQGNRWLGPLAGLAAGPGLGWPFPQGGRGARVGGPLLAPLAAAVGVAAVRFLG